MNTEEATHRILTALFNGGYQGLMVALTVGVGLKALPRVNAATRHGLLFVTLLLVAALPVLHLLLSQPTAIRLSRAKDARTLPLLNGSEESAAANSSPFLQVQSEESSDAGSDVNPPDALVLISESRPPEIVDRPITEPDRFTEFLQIEPRLEVTPERVLQIPALESHPDFPDATSDESSTTPVINPAWKLRLPAGVGAILIALWGVVSLPRLILLARQCRQLLALKRQAAPAPEVWQSLFQDTGTEMGLRRKTVLLMGPRHSGPMIAGFRKPAVLLPTGMFECVPTAQLVQVMRHELGHVIRRDDWTNLFQQVIRAILFFHPAVRWLSDRLTLEREIACDDHVLAATPTPRAYALLLTEFASRSQNRALAAAPAAWNRQTQLKQRIAMILDVNRNSSPRLAGTSAAVLLTSLALFTGLVLQAAPRIVLGAETPPAAPSAADTSAEAPKTDLEIVTQPQLAVLATVDADAEPVIVELPEPTPVQSGLLETSIVVTGPRVKARPAVSVVTTPVPPFPPASALGALPAVPVTAPSVRNKPDKNLWARTSEDSKENSGSASRRSDGRRDGSGETTERRLDRLEKMVEELTAQIKRQTAGPKNNEFALKFRTEIDDEKISKRTEDSAKRAGQGLRDGMSKEDIGRIAEQSRRDVQQAVKEVERATREIERATAHAVASAHSEKGNLPQPAQQELEIQRNVLEATRHSLEEQIKTIERQLEKLEHAKEKVKEQAEEARKKQKNASSNKNADNNDNDDDGDGDGDGGPRKKTAK